MSGTVPSWLARLLGIDAEPGEGTVWSLEHSWGWPPWVTLLFAVLAAAVVLGGAVAEGVPSRAGPGCPCRILSDGGVPPGR